MLKRIFALLGLFLAYTAHGMPQSVHNVNGIAVVVQRGNITQAAAQIIVNAANEELLGGAGVCGTIFKAAGWEELQEACDRLAPCKTGSAVITPSFKLARNGIKHIIHAVGPDCRIITDPLEQDALLKSAYWESLDLADMHGATSVAFPFISSAIFGFPKGRAARIALNTINQWAMVHSGSSIKKVYCVLFSDDDALLFKTLQSQLKNSISYQ